jgi:hypothetical protein
MVPVMELPVPKLDVDWYNLGRSVPKVIGDRSRVVPERIRVGPS